MVPLVYFVVVIDGDPSRSSVGANDHYIMERYNITLELVKKHIDGKGAMCVHTSPRYRNRFFLSPFIEFWESWVKSGGELILHPEEDVYFTPNSRQDDDSYYNDSEHMEHIIRLKVEQMKTIGLPFAAFRGALFGLTNHITAVLSKTGLHLDLSGAPGLVLPERAADWSSAPPSGYYMSKNSYLKSSSRPAKDSVFEIPLGWDGQGTDLSRNYLFHERSTYRRLCKVWDAVVERSKRNKTPQFVNFLCHTYSMRNTKLRTQLEDILDYMKQKNGKPVTAVEAKKIYNNIKKTADDGL
ncbi:MAG: hypothetical protein JRH18_16115 [Deltaproteobacteria bacterium]|nr:hypothetical protein [Deltaproteobacteria bacterium]